MSGRLPGTRLASIRGSLTDRPERLLALRAALVLGAIGLAYHYSLLTLLRNLTLQTPLAYLGLVPFIALALAVIYGRRWRWEPNVHDRQLDYIIGIPLLAVALLVLLVLPVALSSLFWRWRLDLLSLPLFVAGAVTIVFGLRAMLRVKVPIAFLLLAWPLPYTLVINDWLQVFTSATISALQSIVAIVPVARAVESGDGSLFFIPHGSDGFLVSVAAACAGVNGSLGFLLVGTGLSSVLRGGLLRKIAWLVAGSALIWAVNLVRIMLIFAAGNAQGESFAIDALHPVIGLVLFNLGVLVIVLALPRFGLRLHVPRPPAGGSGGPGAGGSEARSSLPRRLPVQRAAIALSIVIVGSLVAGTANAGLRGFQPTGDDLGTPRLTEWSAAQAGVSGWTVSHVNSYPWVKQYFGTDSSWNRFAYLAQVASSSAGGPPGPVFINLDVISTWDLGTFSTYGLEACYGFHNYGIVETRRVDLGNGIAGKSVIYRNPKDKVGWTAVYWEWPVRVGTRERYERIILNAPNVAGPAPAAAPTAGGPFAELQFALASLLGGGSTGQAADPDQARVRDFLTGFARDLITSRVDNAAAGPSGPEAGS